MIAIYNKVTKDDAGKKTGSVCNSANKITFVLNSSLQEEKSQALALRCNDGFKTVGETQISIVGNTSKWALSLDGEKYADYGVALTIPTEITDTNTIIYCKSRVTSDEGASSDVSTVLKVTATIGTND